MGNRNPSAARGFQPPFPEAYVQLLRRLAASNARRAAEERTAKDYAIEFGHYLANAAEQFMAEQNRAAEAGETPNAEYWSKLQSAIHEFRKRADRAAEANDAR